MKTLGERIKESRKLAKLTQEELGKKIGATKSAISQYESGLTKKMDGDKLLSIAKALSVSPDWLMYGKDKKTANDRTTIESNATWLGQIEPWDSDTPLDEDEVELPFFREVEASAGPGSCMVQENHGLKLRFSKSTLKRYNVQAEHAYCITVSGNSMEPAIPDGATVGVDTGKTTLVNAEIYAIDHNGHLRIKVLYKMPTNQIRLRSFNLDEWPDELVNQEDIKILGRVFWWSVLR